MKNFMYFIFFLCFPAYSWNDSIHQHVKKYHYKLEDKFLASINGARCDGRKYGKESMPYEVLKIKVSGLAYLKTQELPIKVGLVRKFKRNEKFDESKKNPVLKKTIVFTVPGAFNNLNDIISKRSLSDFMSLGYHVAIFPDPWGKDFMKAGPRNPPGNHFNEAAVIYKSMQKIYKKITDEHGSVIESIRLHGVSHGSFMALMIYVLNNENDNNPLPIKDVTLFSPPLNLRDAMNNLDRGITESPDFFDKSLYGLLKNLKSVCKAIKEDRIEEQHSHIAKGLITVSSFLSDLASSIQIFDEFWKKERIPQKYIFGTFLRKKKYKEWYKKLTFENYINLFYPGLEEILMGVESNIEYWIERAGSASRKNIRILHAKDDFLNTTRPLLSDMWEDKFKKNIISLSNGGHYGFRNLKWFHEFLVLAFSN